MEREVDDNRRLRAAAGQELERAQAEVTQMAQHASQQIAARDHRLQAIDTALRMWEDRPRATLLDLSFEVPLWSAFEDTISRSMRGCAWLGLFMTSR